MEPQLELFSQPEFSIVAGTDEAGRGPLAGPVYAACTVLPKDFPFEILNDSKKLNLKQRLHAEKTIRERALAWSVSFATPQEIDKLNILNASMLAMKRAFSDVQNQLLKKGINIEILFADGNKKPDVDIPCVAVVKGDSKIHEIMAASILAKTARDRFMDCAAKRWPEYGFDKHKGYPTAAHYNALNEYGPCPIHRKSFTLFK